MSDASSTTTAPADATAPTAPEAKSKRGTVQYTLEIVDSIPSKGIQTSPFEEFLDKIVSIYEDETTRSQLFYPAGHEDAGQPKWVLVGRYDHSTAAGAAANVLGQRHGKNPTVEGWDFTARRIDEGDKTGLFVRYDPTRVVPGAKEAWDKSERDRKAGLAKARDERKAKAAAEAAAEAAAKASTGGTGSTGTTNTGTASPSPTGTGNGQATMGQTMPTPPPAPVPNTAPANTTPAPVPVPNPAS